MNQVPTYDLLINPLFQALKQLGGSGSIEEIYEKVTENLKFPEEVLNVPHNPEKSNQTEVEYRLAWARTYLKKYGVLENSSRGVWAIAPDKRHIEKIDHKEVARAVREMDRKERPNRKSKETDGNSIDEELPEEVRTWREQLHHILTQEIDSSAFERLVKRLLRESGFVQVEVTGRSGDGGIDGKGIARINGLLSFHVIFQCKKYQGAVSSSDIRDFRGAMVGRADKGLFVTTGTFTRDAVKEAIRDGAPPIDLVDGDQLVDKLKELGLGITTKVIEEVSVDPDWYKTL
ncbi:MAG: restriction endonuclease [Azonexus sp.]